MENVTELLAYAQTVDTRHSSPPTERLGTRLPVHPRVPGNEAIGSPTHTHLHMQA